MFRFLIVLVAACSSSVQTARGPARAGAPAASSKVGGGAPCFPDKPSLRAQDIYTQLEKYASSLYATDEEPPPKGTFGTCSVDKNVVRAADGSVVAELGCGVRILKPGIEDELGLQLGAHGGDVLDRMARPLRRLECIPNGPDQARCSFERDPERDVDGTWYVVAGVLDTTTVGADALAYFRTRPIVEIEYSVWCH